MISHIEKKLSIISMILSSLILISLWLKNNANNQYQIKPESQKLNGIVISKEYSPDKLKYYKTYSVAEKEKYHVYTVPEEYVILIEIKDTLRQVVSKSQYNKFKQGSKLKILMEQK